MSTPVKRSIYGLLYHFHFRTWKPRYVCFALTFLAVLVYGLVNELWVGRDPGSVALECVGIVICSLMIVGPLVYWIALNKGERLERDGLWARFIKSIVPDVAPVEEPQPAFLIQPVFVLLVVVAVSLVTFFLSTSSSVSG